QAVAADRTTRPRPFDNRACHRWGLRNGPRGGYRVAERGINGSGGSSDGRYTGQSAMDPGNGRSPGRPRLSVRGEAALEGGRNTYPALPADVNPQADHQDAGKIGHAMSKLPETRPATREMVHPYCSGHPCCDQCDRQSNAEAQDQGDAQPDLVYLKT